MLNRGFPPPAKPPLGGREGATAAPTRQTLRQTCASDVLAAFQEAIAGVDRLFAQLFLDAQ